MFCDADADRRDRLAAMLPWKSPAPRYDLTIDVPWHGDHLLNRLKPKGEEFDRAAEAAAAAARGLLGDDMGGLPVLRGAFPAHDRVAAVRCVAAVDVHAESLEAHASNRNVCTAAALQKMQSKKGILHGSVFQGRGRPVRRLAAGAIVVVDGTATTLYTYPHQARGDVVVREYRLFDGSGYAHTGVGTSPAVEADVAEDVSARPTLGVFLGEDPRPAALAAALADGRVRRLLEERFLGVWIGRGMVPAPGRMDHAEIVRRRRRNLRLGETKPVSADFCGVGMRVVSALQT